MIVIYFCWGGAHSSITSAAVHLGHLPAQGKATVQQIRDAPRFDMATNADLGRLSFMGEDEHGNEIYTLALGGGHRRIKWAINAALRLAGVQPGEYRLVNCLPCVNLATRIGGFSSRSLGWVALGRPLVAWGVSRSYPNYQALVSKVRRSLAHEDSFLDWKAPL